MPEGSISVETFRPPLGRKPEKAGDNGGARRKKNGKRGKKKKKKKPHPGTKRERQKPPDRQGEASGGATTNEQPTAKHKHQPTRQREGKKKKKKKKKGNEEKQQQGKRGGQPQPGGGQAKQKDKAAKGKGEAHQNAPGRPARPTRPSRASTRTHTHTGTRAARSRGRAAGGGTAPDTRRPSQRRKAPPPGTPFRHPHSEQRRPARAHAVGLVQGPHARIDRNRDTRVAEPWLPAPEDGAAGGGTAPDTRRPSQQWKAPPPGTPFRHPHSEQRRPARAHAVGLVQGPHARIDRTRDTRVAEPWLPAPEDGRPGEGQRLTPGAPHNGGSDPPRGRPSATPTASNAGPQGRTLWGRCRVHTPASTAPGTHGLRNPGCPLQRTGGRGRDSA